MQPGKPQLSSSFGSRQLRQELPSGGVGHLVPLVSRKPPPVARVQEYNRNEVNHLSSEAMSTKKEPQAATITWKAVQESGGRSILSIELASWLLCHKGFFILRSLGCISEYLICFLISVLSMMRIRYR